MSIKEKEKSEEEWTRFTVEEPEEPTNFSPFWRQFLAASGTAFGSVSSGVLFGYSATLIPELQKEDSDIQITPEIASWIASTVPLIMAIACLAGGPIMERFGRKNAHFILCVPKLIGYVTIFFAPNLTMLLIGRALGGFSAGVHSAVFPAYLGEISEPKYRGVFLSAPAFSMALGVLLVHLLGTFLNWRLTALAASVLPVLIVILFLLVPETPAYHVSKNRYKEGLKSFKWLRGNGVQEEYDAMWRQFKENEKSSTKKSIKIFEAFKKPEFVKPTLIITCCFLLMQFSGPYIVTFYSVSILEKILGSSINEYLIMNCIDVLRLVMTILATVVLRVSPRRLLMVMSGIGTTLGAFGLAAFISSSSIFPSVAEYFWVSIVALVAYIFFVSIGIFVLPWCMAGELLPLQYRSFGSSLNVALNYFYFFIVVKIAPGTFEAYGIDGAFFIFGGVSFIGTLVLYFVMPETKNRTLLDIERQFSRKRNP